MIRWPLFLTILGLAVELVVNIMGLLDRTSNITTYFIQTFFQTPPRIIPNFPYNLLQLIPESSVVYWLKGFGVPEFGGL